MKTNFQNRGKPAAISVLCLLSAVLYPLSRADLPFPSFTFYGEVRSAYGQPYVQADKVQIIVRVNGTECGRTTVDERLGPGINYRVEVPLDDGQGAPYSAYAARTNSQPTFVLLLGSQEYVVLDSASAPPVIAPGGRARLDFFRDTSTAHDGLPDTWKQMIVWASNGRFTNISQVLPGDDFDGDGMSNLQEFLAGTDPTWAVDRLEIDRFAYLRAINRFAVGYYSVRAKSYQLLGTASLPQWQEMLFSVNSTNGVFQNFWRGDGYYSWLFVDASTNAHRLFRLNVQ